MYLKVGAQHENFPVRLQRLSAYSYMNTGNVRCLSVNEIPGQKKTETIEMFLRQKQKKAYSKARKAKKQIFMVTVGVSQYFPLEFPVEHKLANIMIRENKQGRGF